MLRPLALLALLLAALFLLPAPCLAAEPTVAPAAKATPKVEIDPDMDEGHRQFAYANYQKALEHYIKALERNKEDAYLYFRIGLTYYMLDDMILIEKYWGTAYALDDAVAGPYVTKINGHAMYSTLIPGDVVITDDQYYRYKQFEYNDVVLFYVPESTIKAIGRILSLPGDYVEIIGDELYINDKLEERNFLYQGVKSKYSIKNLIKIQLLKNQVLIVNDNINWHYDSRFFAPVEKENIIGKLLVILESFEQKNGRQIEREKRFGAIIE